MEHEDTWAQCKHAVAHGKSHLCYLIIYVLTKVSRGGAQATQGAGLRLKVLHMNQAVLIPGEKDQRGQEND